MRDPVDTLYDLALRATRKPLSYTLADGATVEFPPLPTADVAIVAQLAYTYANTSHVDRADLYDPRYAVADTGVTITPDPLPRKVMVGHREFLCAVGPGSQVKYRGVPVNAGLHGNTGPTNARYLPVGRMGAARDMLARDSRDRVAPIAAKQRDDRATKCENRAKVISKIGSHHAVAGDQTRETYHAGYVFPRKRKGKHRSKLR